MTTLATLREQAPRISAEKFLAYHPGCWFQYFDDTPAKRRAKACSAAFLSASFAARKQLEKCAVCFSLQAFRGGRTVQGVTAFRNLGVDVDLVTEEGRGKLGSNEMDRRKEAYLQQCLLPFPLKPHWLIETHHGFHVILRVRPVSDKEGIAFGMAVNRSLIRALGGDLSASWLTQVLRVPRYYQFNGGRQPFRCRLLLDNAKSIAPYDLPGVARVLAECGVAPGEGKSGDSRRPGAPSGDREMPMERQESGDRPQQAPTTADSSPIKQC